MALPPGSRLGPYEIVAAIGAGGMGEVYRATDTRLKRQVAIKILPASLAADRDRLARFQREAEVLASLNHPNIAQIYGIEGDRESSTPDGLPVSSVALVMELVEGEDLSAIIARGPVSLSDALPVARQIADALEAAHEQGIIHRDLKPANIKVRADGTVKVLDFGLAKALDPAGASGPSASALANSPTITSPAMTQMGMILGTAAYMAPEQAKGRVVDRRADVWAFGVVLHEMLTGRRLFEAEDVSETLAAVLTRDVSVSSLPATIPPRLRRLIGDCLVRDPKQRLRDIGDARIAIDRIIAGEPDAMPTPVAARPPLARAAWTLAGVLGLALIALGVAYVRRPVLEAEPMRLAITPPEKATSFDFPAISPDGRTLAFIATVEGKMQLWVRPLNSTTSRALADADHPTASAPPFWSPDSQSIAFVSEGKLKKIALAGGAPRVLSDLVNFFRGGTWNQADVILFSDSSGDIKRVSANGGAVTTVVKPDPAVGQTRVRGPVFLPDGRSFVYHANHADVSKDGAWLASVEGGEARRLADCDSASLGAISHPSASGDAELVFVRQGVLLAQAFDIRRAQLIGEPVRIAESVQTNNNNFAKFSLARDGTLVFREGRGNTQFVWVDRTGTQLGTVGQLGRWLANRLSPDGQRLMAERIDGQSTNADLRLLDLSRGTDTRFTFDPFHDQRPIWSPDGRRIVWTSNREGVPNLYQKASNGAGQDDVLLRSAYTKTALDWSPDGRSILYYESRPQTSTDLWVLPLEGERTPWPWLNTPFVESNGVFSPDGKWIAYQSNESGLNEIYAQAFVPGTPASGAKWQLSAKGGVNPFWRRDGRELYFVSPDNRVMAVDVTLGATVNAGTPRELFSLSGLRTGATGSINVTGDGQRFLFQKEETSALPTFTVVLNWITEAKN